MVEGLMKLGEFVLAITEEKLAGQTRSLASRLAGEFKG
jgi:hypothetical protein